MERVQVESSQIKSIGFLADEYRQDFLQGDEGYFGVAEVEFKGGSVYEYGNFPKDLHERWMKADSKGKFFAEFIKPFPEKYPFRKIRGTDREEAKKKFPNEEPFHEQEGGDIV